MFRIRQNINQQIWSSEGWLSFGDKNFELSAIFQIKMNPSFFDQILVFPIINILVVIYEGLLFLHIPYSLGFSIILLTVLLRFILYPITVSQLKASQKMQAMAPHLSRIKDKHKGNTQVIQQETMRLYKEHGINPMAGCLPLLIQLPVFFAIYSVFTKIISLAQDKVVLEINKIVYFDGFKLTSPWDPTFFGLSLGKNPAQIIESVPFILLVPIITGFLQYVQSKMLIPKKDEKDLQLQKEKKKEEDFSSVFQKQSLYMFPVMIGFFSYTFPIGLSLYWNVFTLFGILQQYQMQREQR